MSRALNAIRLALASVVLVAPLAFAAEAEIPVAGWGALLLTAPDGWHQETRERQPVTTVAFTPATGNSFQVIVSPLRSAQGSMAPVTPEAMRGKVLASAEHVRSQAVESNLPVRELRSGSVVGSYFSATDRAPKPGEYKYMTQGMLAVEGLAVAFTILSNGEPQSTVEPALRMLQSARKR